MKEETYREAKDRREQEINAFPIGVAFCKSGIPNMLKACNATNTSEVIQLGGGVFIHKNKLQDWVCMIDRHTAEHKQRMQESKGRTDGGYLYDAVRYELGNYEYIITYDTADAFRALGITAQDLETDTLLAKTVNAAKSDYLQWQEDNR